ARTGSSASSATTRWGRGTSRRPSVSSARSSPSTGSGTLRQAQGRSASEADRRAVARLVSGADAGDARLVLVDAGTPVALYQDRAVRCDHDVPADVLHLGDDTGHAVDERLHLIDHGQLEVRDREARV